MCCGLVASVVMFSQLEHGENTSFLRRVTYLISGICFNTFFSGSCIIPKSFLLTSAFTRTRIGKISSSLKQNTSKYKCSIRQSWLKGAEWVLHSSSEQILRLVSMLLHFVTLLISQLKYLSHPWRSCSHRDWMKKLPLDGCLSDWYFATVEMKTRKSASIGK